MERIEEEITARFLAEIERPADCADAPEGYLAPDALSGLPADTPMLIGYSGGADSSVLLYLAYRYARMHGAPIRILHLHHGIRGAEADRDAAFCRAVAEAYRIPITVARRDVPALARETGESIETAARKARYEAFSATMREYGIPLLLTAHNADDNLETVLFRLLRGSDASGLCGIPPTRPVKHGTVLRPLLAVSRREIERFAAAHAIPFVEDSTNEDPAYARNLLRNEAVPVLRKITPAPERAVARTAAALRRDRDYFDALVKDALARAETPEGLARATLASLPDAVLTRTLLAYWQSAVPTLDSYEAVHVELLRDLLRSGRTGTHLSLPESTAELRRTALRITPYAEPASVDDTEHPLVQGMNPLPTLGVSFYLGTPEDAIAVRNAESTHKITEKVQNIYNSATQIYLRFDTIKGRLGTPFLAVRPRRPGDRILTRGMHRSLRTLLNEAHVSAEERRRIPVVTLGGEPVWVPGVAVRDGIPTDLRSDPQSELCLILLQGLP